ncbi:DUF4345 domain-containing protein [Arthrobacter agilis]|uniref:DUF4345 domain-containing protein n=1 Tax=Arthrobacter agilis TaxID=37921 RepID=UPI000B364358|nr:DUF4345 domain-containing protein [Arthrobacter agilis]OUM40364.1 hypothetical protein B8W74_12575 [Arthrobacter agilis]PPB44978.1 DUF4345 domain-containing protein [Arthrobacter agilis]TPV27680.1 DUF4345 domain-containing protein [Arthrobacter agilis]VDR31682.1 Uncharacterised protein [Arthrobacter agilis]
MTSNSPEHDPSVQAGRTTPSDQRSSRDGAGRPAGTPAESGAGPVQPVASSGPAPRGSTSGPSASRSSSGRPSSSGTSSDAATRTTSGPASKRTGTKDASGKGTKQGKGSSGGDWNVFRTVVVLVGLVIAGFGAYYLILGTAGLPDTEGTPVNPTLENQFRFFSAMMVGVGAAFITIAIKFQWANMLWLVCLMVFVGGIGRVLSWAFSGTPNYILIVLMVVELAFPPALLVWHKYIAKTSELRQEFADRG